MSEAHVLPQSMILWFCAVCDNYTEDREGLCPGSCETPNWRPARQRKRRVWVCADCDEEWNVYSSKRHFLEHLETIDDY